MSNRLPVTLNVEDFTKVYGSPDPLTASLYYQTQELSGYDLKFTINGITYTKRTDYYAVASLNINLPIGEYACTVTFEGDIDFEPVTKEITVTVKDKDQSTITVSDYTKIYGEAGSLKATLTDFGIPLSNKKLIYTINGIAYTKTTNNNGETYLNINLPVGEYTCNVTLDDYYYQAVDKTVTVTVKSQSKLTGSDLTKRASEIKEYNVTLTDGYGNLLTDKPVSITINGVTYNKTTDVNGIARLTIRLGKGNFDITARYDGETLIAGTSITNKVIVTDDILQSTIVEGNVSTPYSNRGFMDSQVFAGVYLYEDLKERGTSIVLPKWETFGTMEDINTEFVSYEITETDPRVKTAKLVTPKYFDLTKGQFVIYITSPYHENFGGKILSADYDKKTGLYTYQCQDGRRNYIKQIKMQIHYANTIYDIIEGLLTMPYYNINNAVSLPISEEVRNYYSKALSGLQPLENYNIPLSPISTPINKLAEHPQRMIGKDRLIDVITNLAHNGQTPVDVHFTPDMICRLDPVDIKLWSKMGIRLLHSDLVEYSNKFDTTNIVTAVKVDMGGTQTLTQYNDWQELRFFFGPNATIIDAAKTSNNSSSSSTSASGNGSSIMSGSKTFVVGCDGGTSASRGKDVINALTAKGHKCINVGVGPSVITNYGLKSASKGKIAIFICNGIDGGNFYDFIQSYYHYDHMILMYESDKATTDKWITCNGMKNTKLYIDPRQRYSSVVYKSGVQNYTAYEWCKKYSNKLSYVCGPLGCKWSDVLNNLVNGNFGSNGTTTTTTSTTNNSSSSEGAVSELQTYEKALQEVSKSIRDLLTFELKLPLNNPLFKELHTNQMLFTELPTDFKLGNLEKIFKIMPSFKVNRGVSYQENKWYIEKIVTTRDSKGLFAKLTLNPFPSSYSVYANAVQGYVDAYNQATNSSSNITTSGGLSLSSSGIGLGTALLGNDCTSTNSMAAMGGGRYGNSGHGKNFDSAAKKGYAVQGANYYTWARQYSNVKDLLHALASKYRYSGYSNNRTCPQKMFNAGTLYGNCYDACRLVKVCCDACGFPCVIIVGSIYDGGHGWNAVKWNGTWYTFDLTYVSKGNSTSGTNSFRSVW